VTLVVMFGPMIVADVTNRPIILDCGGIDSAECDQIWRDAARSLRVHLGYAGTVAYVKLEPGVGSVCGPVTIERMSFSFGVLGHRTDPRC